MNKTNLATQSYETKLLAGEVRELTLKEMKKVLKGNDEPYKKELILRLASSVLPKLNEHSGPDGQPIPILSTITNVSSNNDNKEDNGTEEEDKSDSRRNECI